MYRIKIVDYINVARKVARKMSAVNRLKLLLEVKKIFFLFKKLNKYQNKIR